MSHLTTGDGKKRISLETLTIAPNQELRVGVWNTIPELDLRATDDVPLDTNKLQPGDLRPQVLGNALDSPNDPKAICKSTVVGISKTNPEIWVKSFNFKKAGNYRLELRNGLNVWDWLRIRCGGARPAELDDTSKGTGYLNVQIVWATDKPAVNPLPHYFAVTSLLLEQHGFKLKVNPGPDYTGKTISGFEGGVVCNKFIGNINELTPQVSKLSGFQSNKLFIVMANARETTDAEKDNGALVGQTVTQPDFQTPRNYIILNVNNRSIDGATMVHEMGHAAGFCGHVGDHSKIMSYGARRNAFPKGHISQLQDSFFHSDE